MRFPGSWRPRGCCNVAGIIWRVCRCPTQGAQRVRPRHGLARRGMDSSLLASVKGALTTHFAVCKAFTDGRGGASEKGRQTADLTHGERERRTPDIDARGGPVVVVVVGEIITFLVVLLCMSELSKKQKRAAIKHSFPSRGRSIRMVRVELSSSYHHHRWSSL